MFSLSSNYFGQRKINCVRITPNFPITEEDKEILPNLNFTIQTYSDFRKNFDVLTQPLHDLINTLSKDNKYMLFEMYKRIKILEVNLKLDCQDNNLIKNMSNSQFSAFDNNIYYLTSEISKLILATFNRMNLVSIVRKYVIKNLKFPQLKNAGKRAQDHKDTTFFISDYHELTALSMICKLLMPVFGEIVSLYSNSYNLDKTLKEINAARITLDFVNAHFDTIKRKLNYYINTRINLHVAKTDDINSILKGFDKNRLNLYIYSTILIKKFVNVNIIKEDQNIMPYLYRCILDTIRSQLDSLKKTDKIMTRFTETFSGNDKDDDLLEYETAKHTFNINVFLLVKKNIEYIIKVLIHKFNLNINELNIIKNHYVEMQNKPNVITEIIISSVIGKYTNNGSAIKYLNISDIFMLVAITQLVIIKNYLPKYKDLIFILSMIDENVYKEEKTDIDYKVLSTKGAGEIFNKLIDNLDNCFTYHEFSVILETVSTLVIEKKQLFNVPVVIWNKLNEEDKNYQPFIYDKNILTNIFEFISVIENDF